jgi:predicted nucleotidyltransferase
MRLSDRIQKLIVDGIRKSFGDTEIYLFGSRTDENRKGGDIDIALVLNINKDEFRKKKIQFKKYLFQKGYDLKIDLLQWNEDIDNLLQKEIETNHIRLK